MGAISSSSSSTEDSRRQYAKKGFEIVDRVFACIDLFLKPPETLFNPSKHGAAVLNGRYWLTLRIPVERA